MGKGGEKSKNTAKSSHPGGEGYRKGGEDTAVPSHLWRISGADYDLSSFVGRHPGGPIAIGLGQGEDCTNLFRTYHPTDTRARAVLLKYRVKKEEKKEERKEEEKDRTTPLGGAGDDEGVPYGDVGIPDSEFHEDLINMVRTHFKGRGPAAHKASTAHNMVVGAIAALYLALFVGWLYGSWLALPFLGVFAWLVGVNTSHDASHFAYSKNWLLNHMLVFTSMPFLYNPYTWYHQHVVVHHNHTNEAEEDCDLRHFHPFCLHPEIEHRGGLENFLKVSGGDPVRFRGAP